MTGRGWIDAALLAARPRALAALLRYFRDLDRAEDAYQEACLRALGTWPTRGPPRDPTAWLILVGRNSGLDDLRKRAPLSPLPDQDVLRDDALDLPDRLDEAHYRDDILRLLFICCHPDLPATQQIALALRVVSGLSVAQIARAFLVSEAAVEQRITRGKARVAAAAVPFDVPGAADRADRLATVAVMVYLIYNQGYSSGDAEARQRFCAEAIRLGRLLLRLFSQDPEVMGLLALMLLQHARAPARFPAPGTDPVPLAEQDRTLWDGRLVAEGLALLDKAMRHGRPGPYQVQAAIAALHDRATDAATTDWSGIARLYATLEQMQPSPVVSLNRAVAVAECDGPGAALTLLEPIAERLARYHPFHGAHGWLLLRLGRRAEAAEAFDKAVALAHSVQEAVQIRRHLDRLLAAAEARS